LFDWYSELNLALGEGEKPIVIDADDLVNDTKGVMRRYCAAVGIDEGRFVRYEWEAVEGEVPVEEGYRKTLLMSSGVIRDEVCFFCLHYFIVRIDKRNVLLGIALT
jgi:hypothetical protein